MKVVFIIILLLILLPLALLVLVQFAPPKEAPAQDKADVTDSSETGSVAVRTPAQPNRKWRSWKQNRINISKEPGLSFPMRQGRSRQCHIGQALFRETRA